MRQLAQFVLPPQQLHQDRSRVRHTLGFHRYPGAWLRRFGIFCGIWALGLFFIADLYVADAVNWLRRVFLHKGPI